MQGRSVRLNVDTNVAAIDKNGNGKTRNRVKKTSAGTNFGSIWEGHYDRELCRFAREMRLSLQKQVEGERMRSDLLNSLIVVDDAFEDKGLPSDFQCPLRSHLFEKYGPDLAEGLMQQDEVTDSSDMVEEAVCIFENLWQDDSLDQHAFSGTIPNDFTTRIKKFGRRMRRMLDWSLTVDPGRLTCNLSKFIDEFVTMETFFDKTPLQKSELLCTAFKKNFAEKARNQRLMCLDRTRVVINNEVQEQCSSSQLGRTIYGTSDFIHANFVSGGPLFNRFICTQSPLSNTIDAFWQMVYEQRCQYIFMLCSASDFASSSTSRTMLSDCPYYWPRFKGESNMCGSLLIRNTNVSCAIDPLFTVTYLEVVQADSAHETPLYVQHWQWNWNHFTDSEWPLRLLRRSRVSPSPTVVHCIDGCGRTGTLVSLETALCQLFRGSVSVENAVLSSCLFVRLQRKHAIAEYKQYLFIYRCILNWIMPYLTSRYDILMLGLPSRSVGYAAAFSDLISRPDA
ncbi:hypothetical protein L596_003298 [Steinernema carpocapsae]|uniref:Tyrosine-protein phosphatase domain-containing protein n=1 Tax=Steinernema carpocapsae TaxID=34508 RepID=A0A4U8US85_STECR|nr:hypothetical protein L596_003298 [Steinernema carpocapsae]